jgi:hypothetical protein
MREGRRVVGATVALALAAALTGGGSAGCATSIMHARPDAATLAPKVTAVVALPPRLGFGHAVDQRRTARRMGDALIEATGGHAILADELPRLDPELLADGVRALGEDPTQTLTFSVTAGRGERVEALALPAGAARGVGRPVRRYVDYTVRLDVRRSDGAAVIGSVETFASLFANAPEFDVAGRPRGLGAAIESAMKQALHEFAPDLLPTQPFPTLLEAPLRAEDDLHGGSLAATEKLRRLEALYPEASADDLATLASSRARFLILKPGRLAAVGLQRGDLVSGLGGQQLGSRAAFARTLAHGDTPALSVDRGGGRFLLGQTVVARAH